MSQNYNNLILGIQYLNGFQTSFYGEEYTKESIPFFIAILLELAILVFCPKLVLFIPNLIFGA